MYAGRPTFRALSKTLRGLKIVSALLAYMKKFRKGASTDSPGYHSERWRPVARSKKEALLVVILRQAMVTLRGEIWWR